MAPHLINRHTGASRTADRAVFIERRAEALVRDARANPITGPMAYGWVSLAIDRAKRAGDWILAVSLMRSRGQISGAIMNAPKKEMNSCATE